jgi:hypothetical protein
MARLYELTEAYVNLMVMLEECESEDEREAVLKELDAVGGSIAEKGEAYARMMKNAQAEAEMFEKEIRRLQAHKSAADNLVKRLKSNILFAMGIAGATELNTSIGKWKIQKNNPSVQITNSEAVPEAFTIPQPPKVSNSAILKHWRETGEIPDGCEIVHTDSVRFR